MGTIFHAFHEDRARRKASAAELQAIETEIRGSKPRSTYLDRLDRMEAKINALESTALCHIPTYCDDDLRIRLLMARARALALPPVAHAQAMRA